MKPMSNDAAISNLNNKENSSVRGSKNKEKFDSEKRNEKNQKFSSEKKVSDKKKDLESKDADSKINDSALASILSHPPNTDPKSNKKFSNSENRSQNKSN